LSVTIHVSNVKRRKHGKTKSESSNKIFSSTAVTKEETAEHEVMNYRRLSELISLLSLLIYLVVFAGEFVDEKSLRKLGEVRMADRAETLASLLGLFVENPDNFISEFVIRS